MVRRFIQLPPPPPPVPDFWDPPLAAFFTDSFEVPGWPGLEPPAEPFDFSSPDASFTDSFETSAGWTNDP